MMHDGIRFKTVHRNRICWKNNMYKIKLMPEYYIYIHQKDDVFKDISKHCILSLLLQNTFLFCRAVKIYSYKINI